MPRRRRGLLRDVGSTPAVLANVPWTQRISPGGDTHVQRSPSLQAMMVRFQVAQGARSWGRKKSDGVGSPERSPVSRSASIAVVTANQEAVFSVWRPGKTGNMRQRVVHEEPDSLMGGQVRLLADAPMQRRLNAEVDEGRIDHTPGSHGA